MDKKDVEYINKEWRRARIMNLVAVFLIIGLIILSISFHSKYINEKWVVSDYDVPHLELENTMKVNQYSLFNPNGKIVGFVRFDDIEKQPGDLYQYYIIEKEYFYHSEFAPRGEEFYRITSLVKIKGLPPKKLESKRVSAWQENNNYLILKTDDDQLEFKINKLDGRVTIIDGDLSSLITDDNDYRVFMQEFKK